MKGDVFMNKEQISAYGRELFKILCKEEQGFLGKSKSLHLEKDDGPIFIALLFFLWKKDKDFFAYIMYMREVGISLVLNRNNNFVIIPAQWSSWGNEEDYKNAREILLENASLIKEGLKELKNI